MKLCKFAVGKLAVGKFAMILFCLSGCCPLPADDIPAYSGASRIVEAQNNIRQQLGLAPLMWSPQLAAIARRWAEALIAEGVFHHQADNPYGENLFLIIGRICQGNEVARRWAEESADYDSSTNSCHSVCSHYTQIVWRNTRHVGCASASAGSRQIWVCEYDPPGNYVGERPY